MTDTRYTSDHLWVRAEGDGTLCVGISTYAAQQLGDVVFVELPEVGALFPVNAEMAVVESSKIAVDLRMPVAGRVVAVNERLSEYPETINIDPAQAGWLFRVQPAASADFDELLDFTAYQRMTRSDETIGRADEA